MTAARLAPELIDEPAPNELTKLVCVYGMRGAEPSAEPPFSPLHKVFPPSRLGRFGGHLEALADVGDVLPRITRIGFAPNGGVDISSPRGHVASAQDVEIYLASIPHSGFVALLVLDLAVAEVADAVVVLQETCFRKQELELDGTRLLDILLGQLPSDGTPRPLGFDRDVCQILAPGRELVERLAKTDGARRTFDAALLMHLVYRECASFRTDAGSMRYPAELNRPSGGRCAHGRGVTVLAGAAEHVFWGVVLTAAELTSSARRLRELRLRAVQGLDSLRRLDDPPQAGNQIESARTTLTKELRTLGDLELALSFGVEMYLDSLRMPDIVLESYRTSLAQSLEIPAGVETTGRLLGRFKAVLDARRGQLVYVEARLAERRRDRLTLVLALVTLLTVPASLVMGFMGIAPDKVGDPWGIHRYWFVYLAFVLVGASGAGAIFFAGRSRKDEITRLSSEA